MKKAVKKIENNIVRALTQVCETCKTFVDGFEWLTHTVDHSNFPASLMVTCAFDSEEALSRAMSQQHDVAMIAMIHKQLLNVGIVLKKSKQHVRFATEQDVAHLLSGAN